MTRLEQLRVDAFLTREALAAKAGVSSRTIQRMEEGRVAARVQTLARLSTFFAVPASDLLREAPPSELAA